MTVTLWLILSMGHFKPLVSFDTYRECEIARAILIDNHYDPERLVCAEAM